MKIKLNAEALRAALLALRNLYAADCPLYYSVTDGRMTLESAGGTHRFFISLPVDGDDQLPLQKTTAGAFTQHLSLLSEYADLSLSEVVITFDSDGNGDDVVCSYILTVNKDLKIYKDQSDPCLELSKTLIVAEIADAEHDSIVESRGSYTGDKLFTCPVSISVAAGKANILHADALYLRGKLTYCMSGDGVCRISTPELDEELSQQIDANFVYRITKLGAESYDFYPDYVDCEANGVSFKLGIPQKAGERTLSQNVLNLFDKIQPAARVYCKEVRALYGKGPMRVCADKTLLLADETKLSAPFILPLKDTVPTVAVSETISRAAGGVFTVGTTDYNGKTAACVSGECDIIFNAQ